MPPPFESPSNAELSVLDVLWERDGATVRDVASALHGEPSAVQYRTVQVLLKRLERKGLVTRDRSASPHRYTAAVARSALIGDELQRVADKICEGSLAPLLLNLARNAKLSAGERRALWELLEGD